jgi:hypothetical protein
MIDDWAFKRVDFIDQCLMKDVALRKEEPRTGKRKPIEESEDEEDQKKVTLNFLIPKLV